MDDLVITVHIAERPYRIKVKSEQEEEQVRKAARRIEQQLQQYKEQYHFNDVQDLLSMILLQFVSQLENIENQTSYKDKSLENKLLEIEQLLDKHIKS